MMRDWQPDVMYPDESTPAGLRITLAARYRHLALKFNVPSVSEKFEASWNGGGAVADSEDELLDKVLEELQDCGTERHDWVTVSDISDPNNPDNILQTQRLECIYCDSRERVITISAPLPQEKFNGN
jgi:hypothetical protein